MGWKIETETEEGTQAQEGKLRQVLGENESSGMTVAKICGRRKKVR